MAIVPFEPERQLTGTFGELELESLLAFQYRLTETFRNGTQTPNTTS